MVFPAVFNLSSLNGKNGFIINGINTIYAAYAAGCSVSGAGDVNGDGVADIIIGAQYANNQVGQCYVVFGSKAEFQPQLNISSLNGKNGFTINGINSNDPTGMASYAGDVNGDGIDDVIIGSFSENLNDVPIGKSYVVFGSKQEFSAQLSLSNLNGQNGFTINDISENIEDETDNFGFDVSYAGDINDDGIADIIISKPGAIYGAGQSYVIFGSTNGFQSQLNISSLNGKNGFTINGIIGQHSSSGLAVSYAGDVNGDGITDIIIGNDVANNDIGQSYVVFGSKKEFSAQLSLADLNGQNGFTIDGINENDDFGFDVSYAGDINNDGIDDIFIGAAGANNNAGQSYVIFGSKKEFQSQLNITSLSGKNGFIINGISENDVSGAGGYAGDVNNDGIDDIIIGAAGANNNAGQSYVIFGKNGEFNSPFLLSSLNGINGFIIDGINGGFQGDQSGHSVSGAGDVNADGIDDIIIGAWDAYYQAGQSYVIFGQSSTALEADLDV
jgi:hypothetical protein